MKLLWFINKNVIINVAILKNYFPEKRTNDMNLQKIIISLAFIGVAAPSIIQSGFVSHQKTKSLGTVGSQWNPFNPKTKIRSVSNKTGDAYAYYGDGAFKNPYGDFTDAGYMAQLSKTSVPYLMLSYHYAVSQSQYNPLGAMISYIVNAGSTYNPTPYSSEWPLNQYISSDMSLGTKVAVTLSFREAPTNEVLNFIDAAAGNSQPLDFFFYSANVDFLHYGINGRVVVHNPITGAFLKTDWHKM